MPAASLLFLLILLVHPLVAQAGPTPRPTAICPRGDGHPMLCMGGSEQGSPCAKDADCEGGGRCTRHGHLVECPEQCLGRDPRYKCAGQDFDPFPLGGSPGDASGDRVVGYCSTESNHNFAGHPAGINWGGFVAYNSVTRPPQLWQSETRGSAVKAWVGDAIRGTDTAASLVLGQTNFYQNDWWRTGGDCSAINCNSVPYGFDQAGVYASVGPRGEVWAGDLVWARRFDQPVRTGAAPNLVLCRDRSGIATRQDASCMPTQIAASAAGRVAVADERSRILIWNKAPTQDAQPADVALGAPDLTVLPECNRGGLGAASICQPMSLAFTAAGDLIVSDTGNHRVLLFRPCDQPNKGDFCNHQPAAKVLCQPDFTSNTPGTGADRCNRPMQVAVDGKAVAVADFGNNRVLLWNDPLKNAAPDRVIGSSTFTDHEGGASASRFISPIGVTIGGGDLFVAMGPPQYRTLRFAYPPKQNEPTALSVLGQPDFTSTWRGKVSNISGYFDQSSVAFHRRGVYVTADSNRILYWADKMDASRGLPATRILGQRGGPNDRLPNRGGSISASGFDQPKSVATAPNGDLYVSDLGNNRVLIFKDPSTQDGVADRVIGQAGDFSAGAPNHGGSVSAATVYRPRGTHMDPEGTFWLSDSHNHRVLAFCNQPKALDGICNKANSGDEVADLVLGQSDFTHADASGCRTPGAGTLCFPFDVFHDIARKRVFVLDGGPTEEAFARVLLYEGKLTPTGKVASLSLGSPDMNSFPTCSEPRERSMCSARSLIVHPKTGHLFLLEPPGMVEYETLQQGGTASRCFGMLDCSRRHGGSGYVTCAWSTTVGELGLDLTDNEIWVPGSGEDAAGIMVVMDPEPQETPAAGSRK